MKNEEKVTSCQKDRNAWRRHGSWFLKNDEIYTVRSVKEEMEVLKIEEAMDEYQHHEYDYCWFEPVENIDRFAHYDLVIAWMNGEDVEYQNPYSEKWIPINNVQDSDRLPRFHIDREYRITPKKTEKQLQIEEIESTIEKLKEQLKELKES